jgi:hypothetical protein
VVQKQLEDLSENPERQKKRLFKKYLAYKNTE